MVKTDNYLEVLESSLTYAQTQGYKSYDISDLMKTKYYSFGKKIKSNFVKRVFLRPYADLMRHYPNLIRSFVKEKGYIYPQGQAMIIRALVQLYKKKNPLGDLEEAKKLGHWLINNKSPYSKHFGWGQPFLWYSRKPFPINIPRATVSSQVAWAMLDLFEVTADEEYLDIAKSVCQLFQNDFNYTPDANGNFCLSYTTIDHYHVHNASMLAASAMMRVYCLTKDNSIGDFARKLVNFTVSHQNEDGSFYYWAPPDKLNYKIDNYHTGFVLESFQSIIEDCKEDSFYQKAYEKGMKFYYDHLFEGGIPKMTNKETFPIDIQSCAQSIMTFYLEKEKKSYKEKAYEIADYTIKNFYLPQKKHFSYRIYKDGHRDESFYFRWGDAWMIRALAYLI